MYSRKSGGSRIDPWRTVALTQVLANTSHPQPLKAVYYWGKTK